MSGAGTLYKTLAWLTIGLLVIAMLFTFRTTRATYSALSAVTEEAAWSGQARIDKALGDRTSTGHFQSGITKDETRIREAVRLVWNANADQLRLKELMRDLEMKVSIQGNRVEVVATGVYQPPWLNKAFRAVFGGHFAPVIEIPMRVRSTGDVR